MSNPEYIMCGDTFYLEFRRFLGLAIWEREFERARRQLAKIGA